MDLGTVRGTYFQVVTDLQRSEFARRRGLHVLPAPYHLEELSTIVARLPPGGRVLDIGTGMGIVPETLLRLGYHVIAVDATPSKESQREPLQRLLDLGAEGHFAFVGLEPVPVPDASVDLVLAGDVIEHLPLTPRWFFAEVVRMLKPGGTVVVTTPNAVRLTVRLRVLLGFSNWPPVAQYLDNRQTPPFHLGHHHEYTADELRSVLGRLGFTDVEVRFVEDTLRRPGILRSVRDIETQDRAFEDYWGNRRTHVLNPFELARLSMVGLVSLFPRLRSILLAAARRPGVA